MNSLGSNDTLNDDSKAIMTYKDKSIYNLLQPSRKPTYGSLELKEADKRAVFQKTGPCPQWYSRWRTREFALKDNFLYYYKTKKTDKTAVLGAVYIRGAAIEQEKIKGCKNVLVITPPVPRRVGWKDDETSVFYINFKTAALRSEWHQALKEVANRR